MTNDKQPSAAKASNDSTQTVRQRLNFWDAVSIIVGIVVGTAIFRSPTIVFQNVAGPWQAMGVWLLGGILCLFGALCYAELTTTYPRNGGDYEYLGRAYGPWLGFLFGWAQLTAILTASIGAMAYAFADYGAKLWELSPTGIALLAAGAVLSISVMNLLGIVCGKIVQNFLSVAKIAGLLAVAFAGLFWGNVETFQSADAPSELMGPGLGLALVFVLYAYGGWNDAAFVAAEVRNRKRNLPWALILGIAGITLVYLAVNGAYLAVLGFEGARATYTPAATAMEQVAGPWGAKAISVLVMISALGAINGMILTGSRVYSTLGEDHCVFAWLAKGTKKTASPIAALIVQAIIALLMILAVGTETGRAAIDNGLGSMAVASLPWDRFGGGFDTLVSLTAPIFWTFFLLTGYSVFLLRIKDPDRERPFSIPLYPWPPIIFCGTCHYMLLSSATWAGRLALLGALPVLIGLPLYWISKRLDGRK